MAEADRRPLFKFGIAGRGIRPDRFSYGVSTQGPQVMDRPQEVILDDLYRQYRECNAVRKSIQAIRDYIFQNKWEWEPSYSRKCRQCDNEHPSDALPDFCEECGHGSDMDDEWFEEPEHEIVDEAEKFFERCDRNGHTFLELLKMFEMHLNVADDAFLVAAQDYKLDNNGEIEGWEVKELYVPDPRNFKFIMDPETMEPGGKFWICLRHRPTRERDPETGYASQTGRVYERPGTCEECGGKLYDVWYVSTEPGSSDEPVEYYIGDHELKDGQMHREVIHTSKYHTDYGYGYSPIISVYNMAETLVEMEQYMKTFYDEERVPRSALFIPTRNDQAVRAAFQAAEDKNKSQDGHYIPKFTYDPAQGDHGVDFVEFSKLPQELQMGQQRDEFYRRIGSAFGVAPVFHGNVDAVGLQNQGPTQWQVTALAAKQSQDLYNDKIFPQLLTLFGIDEWDLELAEVQEENEMDQWQVEMMKVQHAQQMQSLGFPPERRDEEGNFEFPDEPQEQPGMGGGLGGMLGGGGPQAPSLGQAGTRGNGNQSGGNRLGRQQQSE